MTDQTSNSALLLQAKQTEVETDHSKVQSGGGPRMPVEGKCPARLIGYVELGVQPQPDYKNKAKDPCMEVQLTFECLGSNNVDDIEIDGKTVKKGRIIRMLPMTVKLNERARFYKTFQDMDYGRGLDHMSKMLNDVFRLTIEHAKSKKGTEYAKITSIESPLIEQVDPETGDVIGTTDITSKVQPASYGFQLFVAEKPTFEQWESIAIDGTYTRKVKNEETGEEIEEEVSKNFIQETIKDAVDWEGSPMQALLLNLDEEEETTEEDMVEEVKETKKADTKKKAPAKKAPVKEATTQKELKEEEPKPSDEPEDVLADLGL